MRRTLLADLVFDGTRLSRGLRRIAIEHGTVVAIDPLDGADALRDGAPSIDARGLLVVPGLVNAHVHVARGGAFEAQEPPLPLQAVRNLAGALSAGTTTIADLGCPPRMIGRLREATRAPSTAGPDIVAAGPVVTAPGGYPLDWMPAWVARLGAAIACGGEREAGRAIETIAEAGMDLVKLAIMHRGYHDRPLRALDVPTTAALVAHAHRSGLRIVAHAHSNDDYRVALAAGVDALMHSSFEPLDDELVGRVKDAGVPVCPTLWVFESICALDDGEPPWERYRAHVGRTVHRSLRRFAEAFRASTVVPDGPAAGLPKTRVREAIRTAAANLALLHDAGVPIVFGNDAAYGFSLVARPVDELAAMHRAGLSVEACLQAATRNASRALGLHDRGEIAVGKRADLVAFPARAEHDVHALGHPEWVMKAGRLVDGRDGSPIALALAYGRGLIATLGHALGAPRPRRDIDP
ncbi:MAG: amidohydrolase family protein [Deltaproteobacteria bacterium]|nr:amidohydrolase family protein [Deltaproteobacteria bacterium]